MRFHFSSTVIKRRRRRNHRRELGQMQQHLFLMLVMRSRDCDLKQSAFFKMTHEKDKNCFRPSTPFLNTVFHICWLTSFIPKSSCFLCKQHENQHFFSYFPSMASVWLEGQRPDTSRTSSKQLPLEGSG